MKGMEKRKKEQTSNANDVRQEKGEGTKASESKMKKKHSPLLDCSVQITSGTKLHDFTPMLILILHQVNRFHDIGMM